MSRQYIETGRLHAEFAQTKDCALEHLRVVSQLHQSRWNSKGESGCVAAPCFEGFLGNLCTNLFDAGEWFSVVVRVDGQIAAGMIGAMRKPFLCTYMSGMNPSLSEHRPGILMNLASMSYAIENGYNKFDMMRGDEVYKSRLGAKSIPQYVWTAYAPRIVPRVLGRVNSAKTQIRQWVRQYRRELTVEGVDA
jgi:CelD/BcsL family acetyltransferase involved in cellulose biosynthesis